MSRLDLLVGPNGAGKTTLFERVIAPDRPGLPFVNADRIARDRFPGHELERAAGSRELLSQAAGPCGVVARGGQQFGQR